MIKVWYDFAWQDYEYWQKTDKKILKKINSLIKDVERNGYKCLGKPEPLKHCNGKWSLRIDDENRLVFMIDNGKLVIFSCKGHYE